MWKDFFYYSKSERRVIVLLLILMAILVAANFFTRWKEESTCPESIANETKEESSQQDTKSSLTPPSYTNRKNVTSYSPAIIGEESKIPVASSFDPNTATREELIRQGLSPFVADNILKYRAKGGKFRTPQSLSRIYGLDKQTFETVRPRITIGESYRLPQHKPQLRYEKIEKFRPGTTIDINTADTTTLKRIPGIGSVYARRIINYRTRLGGFHDVDQLQEISGIDRSLNKWFEVGNRSILKIRVNSASLEELKKHPYMNWQKAKAIIDYRNRYGKIKDIKAFELFDSFTSEDLKRLEPYMSF